MLIIHGFLKRLFDLFWSVVGILLASPLFIVLAIAVKVDSKGPIVFKQARIGKDGRLFNIYKFRSMVDKAESMGTGLFNYEDDPRVTRVGRFLRNTSLDEIPQIFNILKGDMSFVGPRPPVSYELGDYRDFDDRLKQRFLVKPGVTGLAQISGRNELSWDEKIVYDNRYVTQFRRWGLLLDIKILWVTVYKVLRMEGSHELSENAESDQARLGQQNMSQSEVNGRAS